jgi:N-acyl homoserine lactone hydrolase
MQHTPHHHGFRRSSIALLTLAALTSGCAVTQHQTTRSPRGVAVSSDIMVALLDTPGPVTLETIDSARWEVPLSGLLNLEHEAAKAAGKVDGSEPILVPFHVIRHPEHGVFIVDTGVERHVKDGKKSAVRGIVAWVMDVERTLHVERALGAFLDDEPVPLAGVFLTHLHLDHVMGLPDVPRGTPVFAGPGETTTTGMTQAVTRSSYDRVFDGHAPIAEWPFAPDAGGRFAGVVDVFADGSVFAIHTPGHTPGHTAYLVRTTTGPVLLTGDASHTRWGFDHGVEPGSYSEDAVESAESFHRLRDFARAHDVIEVRVGHQH